MNLFSWIFYGLIIFILSFVSSHQVLSFGYWKDDWHYLWCAFSGSGTCTAQWLHPATPTEFIILYKLFGISSAPGMFFGIVLRALAALSVALLATKLTRHLVTALLGGIFFSVTTAGLESIGWPSAHVVIVTAIFVSWGFYFWLSYLFSQKIKELFLAVCLMTVGLAADPWRVIPVVILMHLAIYLFATKKPKVKTLSLMVKIYLTVGLGIFLWTFTQWKQLPGTQLFSYLFSGQHSLAEIFSKIKISGHYFNSLFNLWTGWFIRPQHETLEFSHGMLNKFYAWCGIFITFIMLLGVVIYRKKYAKEVSIILFCLIWTALFFLPSWLFDPRLITAGVHRYLLLPGVGFSVGFAYLLTRLRSRPMSLVFAALFIIMSIRADYGYFSEVSFFRSRQVVETAWQKIAGAEDRGKNILILQGQDPIKTNLFTYFPVFAFALHKNITDTAELPLVIEDNRIITSLVCDARHPLPLSHVYSWYIRNDGRLISRSDEERALIRGLGAKINCYP